MLWFLDFLIDMSNVLTKNKCFILNMRSICQFHHLALTLNILVTYRMICVYTHLIMYVYEIDNILFHLETYK